jgi:SAM-dependent methyltransferase
MSDNAPSGGRSSYRPSEYWNGRLNRNFNLKGVGHHSYGEAYNAWIYRRKAAVLASLLAPGHGRRALDLGSGVGWVVQQLIQRGWVVDGADISDVAVERLREAHPENRFFLVALGQDRLPVEDSSYELVTWLDVTYHIVDDDVWVAGVRDAARVLRPGGALVVLDRFGRVDVDEAAHVRFRSLSRWTQVAGDAGLEVDRIVPAYRWLSRAPGQGLFAALPDRVRGPLDYGLERVIPREPHMRAVLFTKR